MVEEPATHGDSDHTDSGATVDNKNTCELAVTVNIMFLYSGSSMFFNATYSIEDLEMGLTFILNAHIIMTLYNVMHLYMCTIVNSIKLIGVQIILGAYCNSHYCLRLQF